MVKRRKYKRPKATKCNANEQFFNIANIDGSHKVNTQDEDAGKANTSMVRIVTESSKQCSKTDQK